MTNKYSDKQEIIELVNAFEAATVTRSAWKHAEHLTVALFYVCAHDLDTATQKMRTGLVKLLSEGFGVDLTTEMPYHETLTIFWMRTVADFNAARDGVAFPEKANQLVATYDKDYPLCFYSREHLFSNEARAVLVEPDLGPIDEPVQ